MLKNCPIRTRVHRVSYGALHHLLPAHCITAQVFSFLLCFPQSILATLGFLVPLVCHLRAFALVVSSAWNNFPPVSARFTFLSFGAFAESHIMSKATILKITTYPSWLHILFPPLNCSASPPSHPSVNLLHWAPSGNMPDKGEGGRPGKTGGETLHISLCIYGVTKTEVSHTCASSLACLLPYVTILEWIRWEDNEKFQHRRTFGGGIWITGSCKVWSSKLLWTLDTPPTLPRNHFYIHTSDKTYFLRAFAAFTQLFEKQQ